MSLDNVSLIRDHTGNIVEVQKVAQNLQNLRASQITDLSQRQPGMRYFIKPLDNIPEAPKNTRPIDKRDPHGSMFRLYDKNIDQSLNLEEFKVFMAESGVNLTQEQLEANFRFYDDDKDGRITIQDFRNHVHFEAIQPEEPVLRGELYEAPEDKILVIKKEEPAPVYHVTPVQVEAPAPQYYTLAASQIQAPVAQVPVAQYYTLTASQIQAPVAQVPVAQYYTLTASQIQAPVAQQLSTSQFVRLPHHL